jgi:hypothetical protein
VTTNLVLSKVLTLTSSLPQFVYSHTPVTYSEKKEKETKTCMSAFITDDFELLPPEAVAPLAPPAAWLPEESDYSEGGAKRNVREADVVFADLPLSEDGKLFVKAAIDPFHDRRYRYAGYPGPAQQDEVVAQVVRKEVTITKPATLDDGLTWDCHIAATNCNGGCYQEGAIVAQNCVSSSVPSSSFTDGFGLITIVTAQSGLDTFINPETLSVPVSTSAIEYQTLSLGRITRAVGDGYEVSDPYMTGVHRLEGGAFEVHNVTAPLYASGAVTTYRMDGQLTQSFLARADSSLSVGGIPVGEAKWGRLPPATEEQAGYLPSSRTWRARDGAYVVFHMSEEDMSWQQSVAQNLAMCGDELGPGDTFGTHGVDDPVTIVGDNYAYKGVSTAPGSIAPSSYSTNRMQPCGAYFTGLHENTVLKVVAKFLVGRAPAPNSELATLAQPSPIFDPLAWEVYSMLKHFMPTGVPVHDNFLGKWVKGAADVVKGIATSPAVSTAVDLAGQYGGPKAQAAAIGYHAVTSKLRQADTLDRRAAREQHDAAMLRERVGISRQDASSSLAGLTPTQRRRERKRAAKRRRRDRRALRNALG